LIFLEFSNHTHRASIATTPDRIIETKKAKFELPNTGYENGNLSPRIFRKSKPAVEKTAKVHRGRPGTSSQKNGKDEEQPNSAKQKVNKVSKGLEGYLDLVSHLYYGYLPSSSAAREAEIEQKEDKDGFKFTTLDNLLSPLRNDLVYGIFM